MKKEHPLLSVIIPTYNRSALLDLTLKSIAAQTLSRQLFEVIVVDDGSADDSRQVAEKYQDILSLQYFFQEDKGYRVATARNRGINNAIGEFLLFVDSGIILHTNCLHEHYSTQLQYTDNVAVIGYVLGIEEEYDPLGGVLKQIDLADTDQAIETIMQKGRYLDIREKVYRSCKDDLMQLPAPWAMFWTGNVSVSRKSIVKAGMFDEAFDKCWGMEDIELGYRIYLENTSFVLNRKASSIHYPHFSDTKRKLEQERINKVYFNKKHGILESEIFLTCTAVNLNQKLISILL